MSTLLVFHQYLAPYRIDFFNALASWGPFHIHFEYEQSPDHPYDREAMEARCTFSPRYMRHVSMAGRRFPRGLVRILKETRPDIVIVPEFSILALEVCMLRLLLRGSWRIVSLCDDSIDMIQGNELSRLHAWARNMVMPLVDDIILLDSKACDWYQKRYCKGIYFPIIGDEQLAREHCSVHLPLSETLKREYGLEGKKIILYAGRLAEEKNLELLLRAAAAGLSNDAVLVLVGSGPKEETLKRQAREFGLPVHFTGWQDSRHLAAWYNLAGIFVLPSLVEPFGAVIQEALTAGCFCLVSERCGAASLIRSGWNGELFAPKDEVVLAQLLRIGCENLPPTGETTILKDNLMPVSFQESINRLKEQLKP